MHHLLLSTLFTIHNSILFFLKCCRYVDISVVTLNAVLINNITKRKSKFCNTFPATSTILYRLKNQILIDTCNNKCVLKLSEVFFAQKINLSFKLNDRLCPVLPFFLLTFPLKEKENAQFVLTDNLISHLSEY